MMQNIYVELHLKKSPSYKKYCHGIPLDISINLKKKIIINILYLKYMKLSYTNSNY